MIGSTSNANYLWCPAPMPHMCHLTNITTLAELGGVWGNSATSPAFVEWSADEGEKNFVYEIT